jgi:hypothetical protein
VHRLLPSFRRADPDTQLVQWLFARWPHGAPSISVSQLTYWLAYGAYFTGKCEEVAGGVHGTKPFRFSESASFLQLRSLAGGTTTTIHLRPSGRLS